MASKKAIPIFLLCLIFLSIVVTLHWDTIKPKSIQIIEQGILAPTIGTFSNAYGKFWSTRTRLLMYGYALDAFRLHPWLGIGYENYNFYTGNKVYIGLLDFNITWPEVNSYPLKVLTEQGIIGFVAFLFLIFVFFYYMVDARRKTKDYFLKTILEGYIATFAGIAVILLFTSNIMKFYLWISMAFVIAIIKVVNKESSDITHATNDETQENSQQASV